MSGARRSSLSSIWRSLHFPTNWVISILIATIAWSSLLMNSVALSGFRHLANSVRGYLRSESYGQLRLRR